MHFTEMSDGTAKHIVMVGDQKLVVQGCATAPRSFTADSRLLQRLERFEKAEFMKFEKKESKSEEGLY